MTIRSYPVAGGVNITATASGSISQGDIVSRVGAGLVAKAAGLDPQQKSDTGLREPGYLFYNSTHDIYILLNHQTASSDLRWAIYNAKTLERTASGTVVNHFNAGGGADWFAADYSDDVNAGYIACNGVTATTTGYYGAWTVTSATTLSFETLNSLTLSTSCKTTVGGIITPNDGSGNAEAIICFERGGSNPYSYLVTLDSTPSSSASSAYSAGGWKSWDRDGCIAAAVDTTNNRLILVSREDPSGTNAIWVSVVSKSGSTTIVGSMYQIGTSGTDCNRDFLHLSYDETNDNFCLFSTDGGKMCARIFSISGTGGSAVASSSGSWVVGTVGEPVASRWAAAFAGCGTASNHILLAQSNNVANGVAAYAVSAQAGTGTPTQTLDTGGLGGFTCTSYLGSPASSPRGNTCAFIQSSTGNRLVGMMPGLNSGNVCLLSADPNGLILDGGASLVVGSAKAAAADGASVSIETGLESGIAVMTGFTAGDVIYCDAQGGTTSTEISGSEIGVATSASAGFLMGDGLSIAQLKQEE